MNSERFMTRAEIARRVLDADEDYRKQIIKRMRFETLREIGEKIEADEADEIDFIVSMKPVREKYIHHTDTVLHEIEGCMEEITRCEKCQYGMNIDEYRVYCKAHVRNADRSAPLFELAYDFMKKPWDYCSYGKPKETMDEEIGEDNGK